MGAQLRVYRRQIKSVQSTKKITKAMELIAASRIVKAQNRVNAARPYADELTRANRFHFTKDRNHFVVARGLLRNLLAAYLGVNCAELRFSYGAQGKPFLLLDGQAQINFNISHSDGRAAFAFTRGRDLGVDLSHVSGTGPKNRILQDDVQNFVKQVMSGAGPAAAGGGVTGGGALNLLPWPKVDFAKFGPFETRPLSRIKKISGANLARNWVMIPHVTQFDEADITELEQLRASLKDRAQAAGVKLTPLAFIMRACVKALLEFPRFNAALEQGLA